MNKLNEVWIPDPTGGPQHPGTEHKRMVVIGVGNDLKCDDGVGLYVARRIKEECGDAIAVAEVGDDGTAMIDAWQDAELAVICDAVVSGAGVGTVYYLDLSRQPLPRSLFNISTHAGNLSDTIELARTLGQLPPRLFVYGIEVSDVGYGEGLSEEVKQAAEYVVRGIKERVPVGC